MARNRGPERHFITGRAALFERADFIVANLPQFEPAARGSQQVGGGVALFGGRVGLQLLEAAPGNQIVVLGRKEFRAIDGEERLAFLRLARR